MTGLLDLISIIPPDPEDEPEDIFACAVGLIFTDDLRTHHGDPRSTIVYKSQRFGPIHLRVADPERADERRLFSHYLWNCGIKMAELLSDNGEGGGGWSVKGERVLELGAGVGLNGIVATLSGAEEVVMSDYPAPVVLETLERNARDSIPGRLKPCCRVEGHEWGRFDTAFARSNARRFTRILAADCYWMPGEHLGLVRSMLHFLTLDPGGCVFAIAAFHTGRATLAAFFDVAAEEGLYATEIYEENMRGIRREWLRERDGKAEDRAELKKWLVVARLQRRTPLTECM